MIRLQHIALQTGDILASFRFYHELLGLPARYDLQVGRLWVTLADGFTLIFDQAEKPPASEVVVYLGLELTDFVAVDGMFGRLSQHLPIERDLRERYRSARGPYGFFIRDPSGYRLKIFHYNDASQHR